MVMGMRSSGFQCFSSISSCASAAISSARDAARRWGCRTPVDGQRALRRRVATDKPRGGTAAQHGGATAAYAVRVGVGRPARAGRRVRVPVGADMPRSLWLPHPHSARGTHRTPPSGDEMTDCESDQVCCPSTGSIYTSANIQRPESARRIIASPCVPQCFSRRPSTRDTECNDSSLQWPAVFHVESGAEQEVGGALLGSATLGGSTSPHSLPVIGTPSGAKVLPVRSCAAGGQ
jgi:hypothetical protein